MFKLNKYLFAAIILSLVWTNTQAKENVGLPGKIGVKKSGKMAAACEPATSQTDLDINNVRTRLLAGGDMWWDLNDAKYEIPKVEPGSGKVAVHSLFAGALWIGGIDAGGQLKIAAQTYRQTGNDFWPGPLNSNGSVDDQVCSVFDYHWKVNRTDIDKFIGTSLSNGGPVPISEIPRSILEWPGKGNPHAVGAKNTPLNLAPNKNLAPFIDVDDNGIYNPEEGDYPDVKGDQAVWWVYNDKGDIHSETGGEQIGLEIQATAFAFATADEINDMTFYRYNVANFSTSVLDSVFFGQWVDADLGYAFDDFVGCDPGRALGICYNGDAVDGPAAASYGANPPIVGVDFFQGPTKYTYDQSGKVIDSTILGMSKFLYYNNDFSSIGNPEIASHFYGYLSGSWKDGTPFTFGGIGKGGAIPTDYIFPGDPGSGIWNECDQGHTPADRRFIQSSGPFRLDPGANNEVVVGVVWVRPGNQTGCFADFDALRIADDKAQALFDNNFKLSDGPDAPNLDIRELDRKLILSIDYPNPSFNNFQENYEEADPIIKSIIESLNDPNITDSTYNFQGYKIFQLKNAQVSSSEYSDPAKARLVAQVDVKDGISKLVNFTFDVSLGADVPKLMVNGEDQGLRHTFVITEDAFAPGDKRLVNHKTYYYSVVAYAYNNFIPYDPANPQSQKKPYLEGRKNIKVYSAIPHKPAPENGGLQLNADYGDGPMLKRLEGAGNGGNILDLTIESRDEILTNRFAPHPVYQRSMGPVDIKVYDPVKVPNADFELVFRNPNTTSEVLSENATWFLVNKSENDTVFSIKPIGTVYEQLIPKWGLAVTIRQVKNPGGDKEANNGFLFAEKIYADPEKKWLTSVPDAGQGILNWIRSGIDSSNTDYDDYLGRDNSEVYETVINGTWAPFALLAGLKANTSDRFMPTRNVPALYANTRMDSLQSVDIILTSDRNKWSKVIVVEMSDDRNLAEGQKSKLSMRDHQSWTGQVDASGNPIYDPNDKGRSWFPGYAINLETGERLNIIFSEDSWLISENGNDMIWNPTSFLANPVGADLRFGGKHYIYIANTRYDEGAAFQQEFLNDQSSLQNTATRNVFRNVIWASMSMLASGYELLPLSQNLIPTETTIKLRVAKPYRKYVINGVNNGYNMYSFSTGDLAPNTSVDSLAKSALDLIRAVPNPYYAFSEYEQSQLDNRIKITNLPNKCTVSIYSMDGVLIRRFNREVNVDVSRGAEISETNYDTSIDWDLRNHKNVPVASGLYIIHIEAPGIGEKVVKWFGVMRPIDLDTF